MNIIQNIDFDILNFIQNNICNPILDDIMTIITKLGNSGAIWIAIAVVLLFIKKYRKYGVIMLIALLINYIIGNLFMKNVFERTRPYDINNSINILINKPTDYSFPSGHTSSAFVGAVVLLYMNKKIGIMATILAILIAFSRLYLYVHFPSDVLCGFILGTIVAICTVKYYNILESKKGDLF